MRQRHKGLPSMEAWGCLGDATPSRLTPLRRRNLTGLPALPGTEPSGVGGGGGRVMTDTYGWVKLDGVTQCGEVKEMTKPKMGAIFFHPIVGSMFLTFFRLIGFFGIESATYYVSLSAAGEVQRRVSKECTGSRNAPKNPLERHHLNCL